jgi:hypothetical protein
MKGWIRLRCQCGANWDWWGSAEEARMLRRLFEDKHQGRGHIVMEAQR